jgi:hypothetical protein
MANAEEIGWGSYSNFEGPFYRGTQKFLLSDDATETQKQLYVVTATEGGHLDAYNGYDSCISTSGFIQWCNRAPQHSVDDMLGKAGEKDLRLLEPVATLARANGYSFRKLESGKWRFVRGGTPVSSVHEQRRLFFGRSSGKKGQWQPQDKPYAKEWAAAISTVWENAFAQTAQMDFTARRLRWFVMPKAREFFDSAPDNPIGHAFRAVYLSFAANNPKWANQSLMTGAAMAHSLRPWTEPWLVYIIKSLTFSPGIAIYPHRYQAIRPVVERLYGVDLPDTSRDLANWCLKNGYKGAVDPQVLQQALIDLGYDLGPYGADGKFGKKTRVALRQFEEDMGVPEQHQDGYPDQYTMPLLERATAHMACELWVTP